MFGLRLLVQSAFVLFSYAGPISNGDIMPPMVGGQRDSNDCLIGAGFTWCEATQGCIRRWETPCQDNFSDCNDCLQRQIKGENIACPVHCDNETPTCETNEDCGDTRFCRPTTMDIDGPKECVMYSKEGDSCGGYTLPSYESRCLPSLECVNVNTMIADAPGQCRRAHNRPIMVPVMDGPILGASHTCGQCPPPAPCPEPGPDCEYTPPMRDECGCIVGCGRLNCHAIDPPLAGNVCSEVMCMMYCENGYIQDGNGCDTCACVDPSIQPVIESPDPHNPFANRCSILQESEAHKCSSNCQQCNFDNLNRVLGECFNENELVLKDTICKDETSSCSIPYVDCDYEYVCPKITEITNCGDGGINGYTTYQLSLVIKNPIVQNIYAIYGSGYDGDTIAPLDIPPAYQGKSIFNNNIGGMNPAFIDLNPDSAYDSWLTIGLTHGDPLNKLSAIGIDFDVWSEQAGLYTTNGAIFVMNPEINIESSNEYIIAQLTVPNDFSYNVVVNAQGKIDEENGRNNIYTSHTGDYAWKQEGIIFNIAPPNQNNPTTIPVNCEAWYDGCNTCRVDNGQISGCTRMMCFTTDTPYCLRFGATGH